VELDAGTQPALEQIERFGGADLVVGILDLEQKEAGSAVAILRAALGEWSKVERAVVVCVNGSHGPAAPSPDVAEVSESLKVFSWTLPALGPAETPQQSMSDAYRNVLVLGGKLGVRACGVIASQTAAVTSEWISRLVRPALALGFDLVAPCYTRHKLEGLLNRSILSPLHRVLYGERLESPVGPDFGLSGELLQRVLGRDARPGRGTDGKPEASIASTAACNGLKVCESILGARTQPPTDWINLSSLLAQVLGPVFLEMEQQAPYWQSIRGSNAVPKFGTPEAVSDETGAVDVRRMTESFQLGNQNLQDIWGLVLPPTTLLELRRLSHMPADRFRMPDELWVRIVYDFALGHRLRTISRDHLLRSITPLYLGWIASYALEMETAGPAEIESRIEQLSKTYEATKPYLVSRWRWPDRFNP
jgi:hypothetical protein